MDGEPTPGACSIQSVSFVVLASRKTFTHTIAHRRTQISHLRELGTSLADVAAFMQEIELQQGFFTPKVDGRGIERLRFLAMQLEGMGKTNAADTDVSYPLSFTNARSAYPRQQKKSSAADNLQHSSDSDVGRRD